MQDLKAKILEICEEKFGFNPETEYPADEKRDEVLKYFFRVNWKFQRQSVLNLVNLDKDDSDISRDFHTFTKKFIDKFIKNSGKTERDILQILKHNDKEFADLMNTAVEITVDGIATIIQL